MNLAATLTLSGERALIVGGGAVALRRAATLHAAGLRVGVVAPTIGPALRELADDCAERPFEAADILGARVVVACTSSAQVNDEVIRLARAAGALANHAGNAEAGNLRFPALLERGGLTVAVTSGTQLPMLAQAIRETIASCLPATLPLTDWAAQRQQALTLSGSARRAAMGALRAQIRTRLGLPLASAPETLQ